MEWSKLSRAIAITIRVNFVPTSTMKLKLLTGQKRKHTTRVSRPRVRPQYPPARKPCICTHHLLCHMGSKAFLRDLNLFFLSGGTERSWGRHGCGIYRACISSKRGIELKVHAKTHLYLSKDHLSLPTYLYICVIPSTTIRPHLVGVPDIEPFHCQSLKAATWTSLRL